MQKTSGLLFFLAGAMILLGILTAEILYPGNYSVSQNMISNLGSTPPPHSIIHQPSASIFDTAMLVAGFLVLSGAGFLYYGKTKKIVVVSTALLGIGTFCVGIFPAYHVYAHPLSALLAFSAGGVSAIVSSRVTKNPLAFLSIILGTTSLFFLLMGMTFPHMIVPLLGRGGTERWVAYPIILWLAMFGGYLMNDEGSRKH